jgi:hypothetical protein
MQKARVKRVWGILHFFTQFGFIVFTYLSKGSLWYIGKSATFIPCANVIAKISKLLKRKASSKLLGAINFPKDCLIEISQALIALTKIKFSGLVITSRT